MIMTMDIQIKGLYQLLLTNEENQNVDQIANDFYLHQDEGYYEEIACKIASGMEIASAYRKVAMSYMDKAYQEVYADCAFGMGLDEITALSPKTYEENPYFVLLNGLKEKKQGDIRFFIRSYAPYESFIYDEAEEESDINHRQRLRLGYFQDGFTFPAIEKKGEVWMSLIPHEIHTMEKAIAKAKGDCITFGLGLGYYAFMVSEKEEVTSLTVIESDEEVLSLFKKYLLPLFPHKEKIHFIKDDAIAFAKANTHIYDHLFIDIYHNEADGLMAALKLQGHLDTFKAVDFWIQTSILQFFRRYVLAVIEESEWGYTEDDYKKRSDDYTSILGAIYDEIGKATFDEDSLTALLSFVGLKELLAKLKL